ncbi:hypothetical protein N7478_002168 [Penicillium angulare]|uniref:uncharacterized protein n=1 Tax=Penicillium angulare TaxID=116970 RepID=UPI002540B7B1|nr:uncharacterized protein N7478_002168 [Penicillium angulare]KAJ5289138.1 hypothetical protein N7478_002168 [Penicillium angulare]
MKDETVLKILMDDGGFDIPITETLVRSAAANMVSGSSLISYLAQISQDPLPVTGKILIAAAQNQRTRLEMLKILTRSTPDVQLTDTVFEEACANKDVMIWLLDRQDKHLPIEKMVRRISEERYDSGNVVQTLLERDFLEVDKKLVEAMAGNF